MLSIPKVRQLNYSSTNMWQLTMYQIPEFQNVIMCFFSFVTPQCGCIWNKEVIKVRLVFLKEEISGKLIPCFCLWGHSKKTALYKPRRECPPVTESPSALILYFSASRTARKQNFFSLSYPISGILFWQPK